MSRRDEVMCSFEKQKDETAERVNKGIEENRKGDFSVKLTDKNGKPVVGAKLRAKLRDHEYKHGANLFMLGQFDDDAYNAKYEELFKKCFNEATLPIYWRDTEPTDGELRFSKDSRPIYRRPPLEPCVEFCEKNGILPKAHCLTYFDFDPEWIDEYDVEGLKARTDRRYGELAEKFAHRIPQWEVINELLCMGTDRTVKPWFCSDTVLEDCFAMAEKHFPNNELIVNEAVHIWEQDDFAYNRSAYYQMVERAQKSGTRIDCVGMQFHVFKPKENEKSNILRSLYDPKHLFGVLDQYAKLGKPIQITEITVPAYTDSAEDYDLQAEILANLYRIWFSHPAVEAAIYWNLPDGYAAFAPKGDMSAGENYYRGGLVDFALNPKPAYDALYDMFNREYTTDVNLETDADGVCRFRGFYGKYDIILQDKTLATEFTKCGEHGFTAEI